ncbi:MAG: hypothetical protein DRP65_04185 [Planctomycetota bacterium]|nr:MAG: hypothetical protein DRP65_04185 [Planctomycetota bacterium]
MDDEQEAIVQEEDNDQGQGADQSDGVAAGHGVAGSGFYQPPALRKNEQAIDLIDQIHNIRSYILMLSETVSEIQERIERLEKAIQGDVYYG